ncbi:MAG: hypothetical protein KAG84_00025 [Bacteroidales bacterium]|nr:hypothetical protein [Bacteroidales bacterium]
MKVSKDTKKDIEEKMIEISLFWNSDTLSDKEKKSVMLMCNMMIAKRFNAHPTFNFYINNIIALKRDELNKGLFDDWIKSITYYVQKRRTGYLHRYFKASTMFFETHHIYEKSKKVWKVDNAKMQLKIIDNKPVYRFDTVTLVGTTGADSTYISHTTGDYHPLRERWEGHGGKLYWKRVGLADGVVYAKLTKYKISLKSAVWSADSVMFYDKRNFSFGLEGSVKDKYSFTKQGENSRYPSFSSYGHNYTIDEIYENVDYKGGYSLNGRQMIGSGEGTNNAYFIFKHNDKNFVYAGSNVFVIQKDKILSEKVTVTVYLESIDTLTGEKVTDSIYHPSLSLYYSNKKKNLSIYRKDEGVSRTPFVDSYHKVSLYVEELNWKLGEEFIDMKSIQQKGIDSKAYFESENYFSIGRYKQLQGLDRQNPVEVVYNYTNHIGYDEFLAEDFGNYMRMSKENTISYLMDLAAKGFLLYDFNEHYVIVKPSVEVYVKANRGEIDYDVISFKSRTNGIIPNASLNLINNDIILQGVDMVFLSDSQDVRIFPRNGRVQLKKNRDFLFAGKIMAGRFDIYAQEVFFSYDKFKLDLPSIDSMSFKVEAFEENAYGERPLVRIKNVIEDLKGYILIDKPDNKSGIQSFAEFPILNSEKRSYVYYDKTQIYNKVYKRDKFYYTLESFEIDSLDDFKTDGLEFNGHLESAGIFPIIVTPLKVMRDYSVGFTTTTEATGIDLYKGKGIFNDTIMLSNNGLQGKGNLKYLTSTSVSNSIMFFPDSTDAYLQSYKIEEVTSGVEYPPVIATNVDMHWEPYNDLMSIKTRENELPIDLYAQDATLEGELVLSPQELDGGGLIKIRNAELESELYHFKNRTFDSDSCLFKLMALEDAEEDSVEIDDFSEHEQLAFSTSDVFIAHVDFDERKADFESKSGAKLVEFKENLYKCYMDRFTWYMDDEKVEFSTTGDPMAMVKDKSIKEIADIALTGTKFISTHPDQDSLSFVSKRGVYSQREKLIHAFGVPKVEVADAIIIPGNNEMKIFAKAELEEIQDAELLVNRETKYHELYKGVYRIDGKHNYHGRGVYDYKDEDGWVQNILFNKIEVDTAGFTVGNAVIKQEENFTLSNYFDFSGNITLVGANRYLTFDGGTRIDHTCDTFDHAAIAFKAEIDPANISIPIGEEILDTYGGRLYSGLYARDFNGQVYSVFLNDNGRRSDNKIIQSSGFLVFDKISQEYRIASEEKLSQRSLPGNYLTLSRRDCAIYAEGELNLAFNTGHVLATTYGKGRYFSKEDSAVFSVSIPLDFHFNNKAMELMANDLNDRMSLGSVDLENDIYKIMLNNKLGQEMSDKFSGQIITNGGEYRKVPKELLSTLFISDVKMKYNHRSRSIVSTGDIGIASIGKYQVLKYVPGKIEIINKKSGYTITVALDLGGKEYYYFEIKGTEKSGQVLSYSSNKEFVTILKDSKPDDRKYKGKDRDGKFKYYLSTPVKFKRFMRIMKMKE